MTTPYLIDTHVWLWMLADDPRLRPRMRAIVCDTENALVLSIASVWELSIKAALGRLHAPLSSETELRDALTRSGVSVLAIETGDALAAGALPPHHRDPFDRMIVAQARQRGLTILTADPWIDRYDVSAVID